MKIFIAICVFVYGTLVTSIILFLAGIQPDSFSAIFAPWLLISFLLMGTPKKVGGAILMLCHVAMVGSFFVGMFVAGENLIAHLNEESDYCNPQCPVAIPDTSDDIDLNSPSGDNNYSPGHHSVNGYFRGGTYVQPHIRSNPDGNLYNNLNP